MTIVQVPMEQSEADQLDSAAKPVFVSQVRRERIEEGFQAVARSGGSTAGVLPAVR